MISLSSFLAFVAACVFLGMTPGPAIALYIANATTKGTRAGLLAYAGNTLGIALLVAAVVVGMAPLLSFASEWFNIIRIVGALYLVWMGIGYLRKGLQPQAETAESSTKAGGYFIQGLLVALSNPKVLLFLGAFFPQFIDAAKPLLPQLIVLGVTFVVIIALIDLAIVLMSGFARRWLLKRQRATHIASGSLLVGAGLGLAFVRR